MSIVPVIRVISHSETDTRRIARHFVAELTPGTIILLSGDLGAGKTAFVKGLAEGLGLDPDNVTSPTFTLVHEYRGGRLPLLHVDLYRLDEATLDDIGLDTDLADQGVVAVEWPERLSTAPPAAYVSLRDLGGDKRQIEVKRASLRT